MYAVPPEVKSSIKQKREACELAHEEIEPGFITRQDVNGDHVDDYILDYGKFICGVDQSFFCGTEGCLTEVFVSLPDGTFKQVLSENVREIRFARINGLPAMIYKDGIDTGHCFQYQGDGPCRQQLDTAGNRIVIDPVAGSAPLRIGTQDGKSYFQGGIAALRIWNRALANTEVSDLYQSDQVPPDGLIAQYLLDEGSGTVAFDTSGGNNNGTIHGATWKTM